MYAYTDENLAVSLISDYVPHVSRIFYHLILFVSLLTLLSAGALLRFSELNRQSYWMDEGYTINAILSQTRNGTRRLAAILDSGQTYFCPTYCYPTAVIAHLLGDQPASYRLFSALCGFLFIFVTYFVTQTFFKNKNVSLLAAFFVTFSYWQIAWSRQARWYTLLEVFFWLALGAFYQFLQAETSKKRAGSLVVSLISTVLAIATQGIAYLLPVILFAWYVIEKRPRMASVLTSGGITLAFLAFLEFGLGLRFIVPILQNLKINNHLFYYGSFYLRTYWPLLPLLIYAFFYRDAERRGNLTLVLPFLLYLFCLSFLTDTIEYRYLFHVTPALFMISALACIDIIDRITHTYAKTLAFAVIVSGFFVTGLGIVSPKAFYALEADNPETLKRTHYAYTPQPDFTAAYTVIQQRLQPEEIVVSSHPHFNQIFLGQAGYWLGYDYLGRVGAERPTLPETEGYVGARTIRSLDELQGLMSAQHGYVVFDYMSVDGRIDKALTDYLQLNARLIFYAKTHAYSQIWIYQF